MRRRRAAALVALLAGLAAGACRAERADPGELVRRTDIDLPATDDVDASRIRYGSLDVHGDASTVDALLAVPAGDPPPGGWPIVAFAHGTTGAADECAPSRNPSLAGVGAAVGALAAGGYLAVATDYEGIGTRGPHPYLHGPSEARAIVDSVRAARRAVPSASDEWVVVGHSQGGHAALFTAQLAPELAPELELLGAVAVAPAADPASLIEHGGAPPTALLVHGWLAADEDADLDDVEALLTETGVEEVEAAGDRCDVGVTGPVLAEGADVEDVEAFAEYLDANVAGQEAAEVPVLVVQGTGDELTPVEVARAAVERLCEAGSTVALRTYPGADHLTVVEESTDDVTGWIADRFAGEPAPSTC